jgi:hypothetical protein
MKNTSQGNNSWNSNKKTTTKTIYVTSTIKRNNSLPTFNSNPYNKNIKYFDKRGNTKNDEQVYIKITSGKVYVKVDGRDVDGIDSNGSLYIGGDAEVYVSNGSGDIYGNMASLDSEGSNVVDIGATVVVTASGMSGHGPGGPGGPDGMNGPPGMMGQGQGRGQNPPNMGNQEGNVFNIPDSTANIENEQPTNAPQMEMEQEDTNVIIDTNIDENEVNNLVAEQSNNQNENQNPFDGMKGQNFNQTSNPFENMGGRGGRGGPGGMGGPGGPGMETGVIKQANVQVTVESQEAGTEIILKDNEDNVIISHKPETAYSKILITTPKLVVGANYTVIAGTETQTVTASVDSESS